MRCLAFVVMTGCGRLAFEARNDLADAHHTVDARAPVPGLQLHFAFESDGFLHDSAGGYEATCTSCPTPASGVTAGSGAASFDGIKNCLVIPVVGVMPPAFTYAIWERTAQMRTASIFGRARNGATTVNNAFEIYMIGNVSPSLHLLASDATLVFPRTVGDWHHVAGVFDGSTFTVYLDGTVQDMSSVSPVVWTDDAIRIGCDLNAGIEENYFKGVVDDARLYSRTLTSAEIVDLATP